MQNDQDLQAIKVKDKEAPFFVSPSLMRLKLSPSAFTLYVYILWATDSEESATLERLIELSGMQKAQALAGLSELRANGLVEDLPL